MLVIQSYRSTNVPQWIQSCLDSVSSWAHRIGADYHLAEDEEILSTLSLSFKEKVGGRWPMLTDLGRLKLCQRALEEGRQRVVWLDADVYIFKPDKFTLPAQLDHGYAFGKEVWIEDRGRVRHGVHNAFCIFESGNPFLDFYAHCCERIIANHTAEHLAPQLLGPKILKAQNAFLQIQQVDQVAMFSPAVVEDLINGGGKHLDLQNQYHPHAVAANLCSSLLTDKQGKTAISRLAH